MTQNQLTLVKRDLRQSLQKESFKDMLGKLASNRVNPETIVEKAYFAISKNSRLLQCTQESLITAVVASALLGLDCTGTLGQGYLVPFGKECVFIAGYQGLIELARRSGHIDRIEARPVYEKDEFQIIFGSDQVIKHVPFLSGDPGKLVCAYAIAEIKNAGKQIEIMRADEIDLIKKRSPSGGKGPWETDYSEMCRKTVVRRLIKYIPKSPELVKAIEYDDGNYDFDPRQAIPVESTVKPVADRIKDGIAGRTEAEPPAEPLKKPKKRPKTKPKAEASSPRKAPAQEPEPAGSDAKDPAPPETPEDTSPAEPEEEAPANKYKCLGSCKREFAELKDGKQCPYCYAVKFEEL